MLGAISILSLKLRAIRFKLIIVAIDTTRRKSLPPYFGSVDFKRAERVHSHQDVSDIGLVMRRWNAQQIKDGCESRTRES